MSDIEIKIAELDSEIEECYRIRHEVFVTKQGLFKNTDIDEFDEKGCIHLVAKIDGRIVGSVRVFSPDNNVWYGSRLAVKNGLSHFIGSRLVRSAVDFAKRRNGTVMFAYIQMDKVRFFKRLGWIEDGCKINYYGKPHIRMKIEL